MDCKVKLDVEVGKKPYPVKHIIEVDKHGIWVESETSVVRSNVSGRLLFNDGVRFVTDFELKEVSAFEFLKNLNRSDGNV